MMLVKSLRIDAFRQKASLSKWQIAVPQRAQVLPGQKSQRKSVPCSSLCLCIRRSVSFMAQNAGRPGQFRRVHVSGGSTEGSLGRLAGAAAGGAQGMLAAGARLTLTLVFRVVPVIPW